MGNVWSFKNWGKGLSFLAEGTASGALPVGGKPLYSVGVDIGNTCNLELVNG